jgi:hypothetical protein
VDAVVGKTALYCVLSIETWSGRESFERRAVSSLPFR